MMRKTINEKQVRTILAVFDSIQEKCHYNYEELNTILGSLTIQEMYDLKKELDTWYHAKVLEQRFDEEFGWYDPKEPIIF